MGLTKTTQAFVQKMIDASFNPGWTDITTLGCGGNADCGKILTNYINSFPISSVINLYVPKGVFYILSTLNIVDRKVNIRGLDRGLSIFYVKEGVDGIFVDRKQGIFYDYTFERFALQALSKTTRAHGIKMWQRGILRDLDIQNFNGNGVYLDGFAVGDADKDAAHNCTFSKVYDCLIAANSENGIYIDGQDGSACIVMGCDIRNNGMWALWDSTFLGCSFLLNLMHQNAAGALFVEHPNATGVLFAGNYLENNNSRVLVWESSGVVGNTGVVNVEYWKDLNEVQRAKILEGNR